MRLFVPILSSALLVAVPASATPPREQSPAPKDLLAAVGSGNSDAELQAAIAAAAAHPLGSLQNPVRVGGPEGEQAYLARLRCGDGSAPKIGAKAAGGVGAYGSVVDSFALDCSPAAPGSVSLAFDIYHQEHVEQRAPAGFRIQPR
jgi:hypothetical protein